MKTVPVHSSTRRVPRTVLIHAAAGVTTICAAPNTVVIHERFVEAEAEPAADVGEAEGRDPRVERRDERAEHHRRDADHG